MQISKVNFLLPRVKMNKLQNFEKKENNISFKQDINEDIITIIDYPEIMELKKFAKKCEDNVALKILRGSYIDSIFVKSQSDLIENKGEWLDITNYDNM